MKKRKITDNIPLKIMSVAIAVVLWLIVVNIDNPTGTNYYTLNDVELINKEYVESSDTIGKMCMPEQNQDSIKVAITATKKIRDKIKVTDISAVADLQQAVIPFHGKCPLCGARRGGLWLILLLIIDAGARPVNARRALSAIFKQSVSKGA